MTDAAGTTITYSWDALDQLASVNAAGSITAIGYGKRGFKTSMLDPAMGSWTYAYNAFGELVSQRDSLNQTVTLAYDARDNITYKTDVGRYWYDPARPNRMTQVTLETAPGAQIALTGTRALSYAFDDTKTGAQSVNGTTVGNGNLEYTVSQDRVNSRHTFDRSIPN